MPRKSTKSSDLPPDPAEWTTRDQEMVTGLSNGESKTSIADRLGIDRGTVAAFSNRPVVVEALRKLQTDRWQRCTQLASSYHGRAIEKARELVDSENEHVALNASRLVHTMIADLHQLNVTQRVEDLERALKELRGD